MLFCEVLRLFVWEPAQQSNPMNSFLFFIECSAQRRVKKVSGCI
jgi:hypothetical protein